MTVCLWPRRLGQPSSICFCKAQGQIRSSSRDQGRRGQGYSMKKEPFGRNEFWDGPSHLSKPIIILHNRGVFSRQGKERRLASNGSSMYAKTVGHNFSGSLCWQPSKWPHPAFEGSFRGLPGGADIPKWMLPLLAQSGSTFNLHKETLGCHSRSSACPKALYGLVSCLISEFS